MITINKNFGYFSKILLFITISVSSTFAGCSETYMIKDNVRTVSLSELQEVLDNKETFILEVRSDSCKYCTEFEEECLTVNTEEKIELLQMNLSDYDVAEVNETLDYTVEFTPTIMWIQEGKVDNEFPVDVINRRKELFKQWIDDNFDYHSNK